MLPVDCPFLISPSGSSNVYLVPGENVIVMCSQASKVLYPTP